jgi:multidrug efflux pump subunit AcrB
VELQNTNKLEETLKSVVGIKSMSSTSVDSSSSINIAIDEDADSDEVSSAYYNPPQSPFTKGEFSHMIK